MIWKSQLRLIDFTGSLTSSTDFRQINGAFRPAMHMANYKTVSERLQRRMARKMLFLLFTTVGMDILMTFDNLSGFGKKQQFFYRPSNIPPVFVSIQN